MTDLSDFLTKIDGLPNVRDALPGMAFFAGTGPAGKTCGDCKLRGMTRYRAKMKFNEKTEMLEEKTYRTQQCRKYRELAMRNGPAVNADYKACKYFEQK